MSPERETEPLKDVRFAADLRRQFEDLAAGTSPTRGPLVSRAAASARRHLWVVGAAAATAVVLGLILVGLPGVPPVSGPEPVSAAQVIERALHALSSGETLQADSVEREALDLLPDGAIAYKVARFRVLARADGSLRQTQIGKARAPRLEQQTDRLDAADLAYDAAAGVLRDYWRGWVTYGGIARYENVVVVTTGYPLGPPDRWANFQSDLSATALAARASSGTTLATTSYDGRPAWAVSGFKLALSPYEQTYSVTIDQGTCLPVRLRARNEALRLEGFTMDWSWKNVRVDEPLPDAAFTFTPPKGAELVRHDAGFRRLPLDRIASRAGHVVLLPAQMPAGYVQKWTAWAARSTTANGVTEGRDVIAVQYVRGFDSMTITTRTVTDPQTAAAIDPIEPDTSWAGVVRNDVRLSAGAFAGETAAVVVAPRITVPHLYAVKGDVLLTVAGSATAEELIAVAQSLRSYRPD